MHHLDLILVGGLCFFVFFLQFSRLLWHVKRIADVLRWVQLRTLGEDEREELRRKAQGLE